MLRFLPLALILIVGCAESGGVGVRTGQKAPDFIASDTDGNVVKLSDYEGKVILLDFWATWCGPCVKAIPHEKELVERFAGKPFVMLGISQDHTKEALTNFLKRTPLPWKNLYEGAQELGNTWEVEAIPTFVVIDAQGIIRGRWEGGQIGPIEKRVAELLQKMETQ